MLTAKFLTWASPSSHPVARMRQGAWREGVLSDRRGGQLAEHRSPELATALAALLLPKKPSICCVEFSPPYTYMYVRGSELAPSPKFAVLTFLYDDQPCSPTFPPLASFRRPLAPPSNGPGPSLSVKGLRTSWCHLSVLDSVAVDSH